MDIGAELRQAREQRGLSLQDLAQRTKISLAALRALENNAVEALPGGVFTRGFLKAYAREVGLDPAEITQRYTAQFEPPPPPASHPADVPTPPLAAENREPRWKFRLAPGRPIERAGALGGVGALVIVAAIYVAFARWYLPAAPDPSESQPASAPVPAVDDRSHPGGAGIGTPTATKGSTDGLASPAETSGAVLRIDLQPSDRCWISATADGKRVAYRLMRADDRETIEVHDELVLRIGEPANLRLTINGSRGRLAARPGSPATVRITRQNYRDFLAQ